MFLVLDVMFQSRLTLTLGKFFLGSEPHGLVRLQELGKLKKKIVSSSHYATACHHIPQDWNESEAWPCKPEMMTSSLLLSLQLDQRNPLLSIVRLVSPGDYNTRPCCGVS
jgi:hypothetical protein